MQNQSLPCDQLKAELARLCRAHNRSVFDGDMRVTWRGDELCLAVSFPDGMAWEVPFDAEAQTIIQSANATKH
ncbi:hypothetical protein GCM10022229_22960 [Luteimonas lutimaris]|uniref:Uncharacterized protein n=1 Tax=Luteimonas lutimaris TaxID=698645 RepID=A0ABP7MRE2_9GAMM